MKFIFRGGELDGQGCDMPEGTQPTEVFKGAWSFPALQLDTMTPSKSRRDVYRFVSVLDHWALYEFDHTETR